MVIRSSDDVAPSYRAGQVEEASAVGYAGGSGRCTTVGSEGYGGEVHDEPLDPFAGDPADPAAQFADEPAIEPLTPEERQDVLDDLADLEIYQAVLTQKGYRGLLVECEDCREPHYFDWELLRGNLRQLLTVGRPRIHEPAFEPNPDDYVTWEYARGYVDAAYDALLHGNSAR